MTGRERLGMRQKGDVVNMRMREGALDQIFLPGVK